MGSQRQQDELTVLVTGFGPFRTQYPVNPSWEIAKGLPPYLPPLRAKDPSARDAAAAAASLDIPRVRILVHPEPIRVNYKVVRALVPSLWDTTAAAGDAAAEAAQAEAEEEEEGSQSGGGRKPDVVIHIGMAGPRPMYQIERRGHRMGYKALDVDGEVPEDEKLQQRGEDWIWNGLPDELQTDLDMPDVLERWKRYSSKDMDLRISDDAGRYLCDFTYFSSLAHLYKQGRERKVVFLHVPSDASEWSVTQGRELALNLIRSIVESEVSMRDREEGA